MNQPYIDNELTETSKLTELFWQQAERPSKTGWFIHGGYQKEVAADVANHLDGYYIWGAYPFLAYLNQTGVHQAIIIASDPALKRVMSISLVNGSKFPNTNTKGAKKLEDYLLSSSIQARISQFRIKGSPIQLFWAMATNN